MDTLINHVAALWNPVAQISKRLEEEKLTVLDVLPLFMANQYIRILQDDRRKSHTRPP